MISSTARQVPLAISRQACRWSLALASLVFLAIAPAKAQVKLNPAAAPNSGQPGVQLIKVTGSGFPGGTIPAQNVTVSLAPAVPNAGPTGTATATAVTLFFGTMRSVSFQIPAAVATQAPTAYKVSISGTTSGGVHFSSSTSSSLTINPPASVGFSPGVGDRGQSLTVMITGNFTNFLTGSTQANFGTDISVGGAPAGQYGPLTVTSSTLATASLVISPSASLGGVQATVATGVQTANASFTVREVPFFVRNFGGKCLDYGASPSGNLAAVFLNDCATVQAMHHSIRVVELSSRMDAQNNVFSHEVLLFVGNFVIGIHRDKPIQVGSAPAPVPPATEYSLEFQKPYYSIHTGEFISPADQIFRLDGDSIILEGTPNQPTPCINTVTSPPPLCQDPPPQLVIQIQNARGANGSPLVAGVRNLADNEFWDFQAVDGSARFPSFGFMQVSSADALWNKMSNAGWGSVIVVTTPDPCNVPVDGQPKDIGGCIDLTLYPPVVLPAGATLRGDRRGTLFGPQLYANYSAERGDCGLCMLEVSGDYARVSGLRLRGASRLTDEVEPKTDGVEIAYAGRDTTCPGGSCLAQPPAPDKTPLFTLNTFIELIATIDHNDMSDWGNAGVQGSSPFFNSPYVSKKCGYDGYVDKPNNDLYPCDESLAPVPFSPSLGRIPAAIVEDPFPYTGTVPSPGTLANVRVARNFLHHNMRHEGGYGASVTRALIEGNTFLSNRHDITANGEPHNEYRASHNLVLSNAPAYPSVGRLQDFDMHGTDEVNYCFPFKIKCTNLYYGGAAGYYVDIVGNTFLGHDKDHEAAGQDYRLRGYPIQYTDYHGNVSLRTESNAVELTVCGGLEVCSASYFPINIADNNRFRDSSPPYTDPTARLAGGDFDGDGVQDLFLATGNTWFYSPGGQREWRYLNAAPDTIDQLLFGDFDGDGRTDVVAMRNGQLVVSWGGISAFEVLNTNPCPPPIASCNITDMAVGKFLDHPAGDRRDDLFLADGKKWYLSSGGSATFSEVNTSSFRRKDVLFGDFNSDRKTDVFGVVFDTNHNVNSWSYTSAAAGGWIFLRPAMTNTVDGLVAADFDGDGFADIGMLCSNGSWEISYGGTQVWSNCSTLASLSLVDGGVGHFSGGAGADILLWNGDEFWVVPGGTGLPQPLSTQDMR